MYHFELGQISLKAKRGILLRSFRGCITRKYRITLKKVSHLVLVMILLFSFIHIIEPELKFIDYTQANTTWYFNNWSKPKDYNYISNLVNTTEGALELMYGQEIYITDLYNYRVVKTRMDGSEWTTFGTRGTGKYQFYMPYGLHYDIDSGYIYVCDLFNYRIVKTQINGSGWTTLGGQGSGTGQFNYPMDIYYENTTDYVYVADYNNHRIVKTMMNGTGWKAYGEYGSGKSQFYGPTSIFFDDTSGYVYICDYGNSRIVRTMMNGSGWDTYGSLGSGTGEFNNPYGLYFDKFSGYLYITDMGNSRIVKTKFNGSGWTTYGSWGYGTGNFYYPCGISYDRDTDYIYVADMYNSRIVRTKIDGTGWNTYGSFGTGTGQFYYPRDVDFGISCYCTEGSMISKHYDCEGFVFFKTMDWTSSVPLNTTLKLQLRTATTEAGLSTKPFVGPNGSVKDYYTTPGTPIWSGHDGDRWLQYKVILATENRSVTPILNDITIEFNRIPTEPTLLTPKKDTWTKDNTPTFTWMHNDSDSERQISFQWQVDNDIRFTSIDYDSNNITTQASTYKSISHLPDGGWYWRIRTQDSDGAWGPFSGPRKLYIDTTPPNSNISLPESNMFYNRLNCINGTSTDSSIGIGVARVEITIERIADNSFWNGTIWVSTETWLKTNISPTSTGNFQNVEWTYDSSTITWSSGMRFRIKVRANDALENLEQTILPTTSRIFSFDSEAPSSRIEYPVNGSYLNKLPKISGSALDIGGSGLNKVEITIENANSYRYWTGTGWSDTKTWLAANGNAYWTYDSRSVRWSSGVEYNIVSRAYDNISNIEKPKNENKCVFNFDKGPPYSEIDLPVHKSFLNELTMISGHAGDLDGAGIDGVEICIQQINEVQYWDGYIWSENQCWYSVAEVDKVIGNWSINTSNIPWKTDKNYKLTTRAFDLAGNLGPTSEEIVFMYDDTPPQIDITINKGEIFTKKNSIVVNINSIDTGSGLSSLAWSNDSINWSDWMPITNELSLLVSSGDGEKSVYVKVCDLVGNIADAVSDSIILDTTPPEIYSFRINNDKKYTNSNQVRLTYLAKDQWSGVQSMAFSFDQKYWTPWEPFKTEKNIKLSPVDGKKVV